MVSVGKYVITLVSNVNVRDKRNGQYLSERLCCCVCVTELSTATISDAELRVIDTCAAATVC